MSLIKILKQVAAKEVIGSVIKGDNAPVGAPATLSKKAKIAAVLAATASLIGAGAQLLS
jgi:hypothetical protein